MPGITENDDGLLVPFIFNAFVVGSFVIFKYYLEAMTATVMVMKVTFSNNLIDDVSITRLVYTSFECYLRQE
jgi:hypothetical protein